MVHPATIHSTDLLSNNLFPTIQRSIIHLQHGVPTTSETNHIVTRSSFDSYINVSLNHANDVLDLTKFDSSIFLGNSIVIMLYQCSIKKIVVPNHTRFVNVHIMNAIQEPIYIETKSVIDTLEVCPLLDDSETNITLIGYVHSLYFMEPKNRKFTVKYEHKKLGRLNGIYEYSGDNDSSWGISLDQLDKKIKRYSLIEKINLARIRVNDTHFELPLHSIQLDSPGIYRNINNKTDLSFTTNIAVLGLFEGSLKNVNLSCKCLAEIKSQTRNFAVPLHRGIENRLKYRIGKV